MRYRALVFEINVCRVFLRVGLCSHTFLFCRRRGDTAGIGCDQDVEDRVDPSPRDHQITTCAKDGISGDDPKAYLTPRGDIESAYRHQREGHAIAI